MWSALACVNGSYGASKGYRGSCGTGKNDAGVTQGRVTRKFRTKESASSRIENQAEDFRLSTIEKCAGVSATSEWMQEEPRKTERPVPHVRGRPLTLTLSSSPYDVLPVAPCDRELCRPRLAHHLIADGGPHCVPDGVPYFVPGEAFLIRTSPPEVWA